MEQYTRLTPIEIETVAAKFNLAKVSSFGLLSGGSQNTNYLLTAENGKYVLSICEQSSIEETIELALLLAHLEQNNFKSSKIIPHSSDNPILVWKGKPVMLKQFIEGRIQQDLPPRLLKLIGRELAKLHQVEAPTYLPKQLGYGKEQFKDLAKYAANSPFEHWLKEMMAYLSPYFNLDLPKVFIHSDLFWNNVIISEDENTITILDFEEAAYYYRVYDIGMAIIGICGEGEIINMEKVKYLLQGYQQEIQLLDIEMDALKAFTIYAGASMTFWRHRNFNYTKPDPQLFDHYLGLKVLTDYISAQADNCFSKLLKYRNKA